MNEGYLCVRRCRSPLACDTFGYCRERNQDGAPVNERENQRRKAESDAVYAETMRRMSPEKPAEGR